MFSIFDESINEVPILAASLNQWGAKVESDQSTLYAKVDSGFTEIGAVVIELRGQVLTQGAHIDDVHNHAIRLEQRMEQVEQIGIQAMTELANLMNGYQHKFVEMEGAINALAASAESNLKARQGQLVAELQHKFLELGGNDETVKAAMTTLLARVAALETALNERTATAAATRQDPWWSGPRGLSRTLVRRCWSCDSVSTSARCRAICHG